MANQSLKSVYLASLQDMVAADRQSLELTKELRDAATDTQLQEALEDGVCGIADGLDIVREVLERHDGESEDAKSDGMAGIVAASRARVFDTQHADDTARDAAIIAQFMHLTYYGLAGYRTLTALAEKLGLDEDADTLGTCYENAQDGQDDMEDLLDGDTLEATE